MTGVKFHVSQRIESFVGADGSVIPDLMVGDNYMIPDENAKVLQERGAGHIVRAG